MQGHAPRRKSPINPSRGCEIAHAELRRRGVGVKSTEAILPRELMQFWPGAGACMRAYEGCNFVFHQNERVAQLQGRQHLKTSGSVDLQSTVNYTLR